MDNRKEEARPKAKVNYREKYEALKADVERRIIEKEKYITKVEEECDARVQNKDFIIGGLNTNLEIANRRIKELEDELSRVSKQAHRQGFVGRLFKRSSNNNEGGR